MARKITFNYGVEVEVQMKHEEGAKDSQLVYSEVWLKINPPLDKGLYSRADGCPNAAGVKMSTSALVCGLANNIHEAHKEGYWDSAAHLRWIIAELERQFVAVPSTEIVTPNK